MRWTPSWASGSKASGSRASTPPGGSSSVGAPRSGSDHSAGCEPEAHDRFDPAKPRCTVVGDGGRRGCHGRYCVTVWSRPGRVRSEAAFASLAGVSPLPASSGNTVRHRLNRGGDRRLNRALHTITMTRMVHDPGTGTTSPNALKKAAATREVRRSL
ncbi:transposase [Arthrobacter sp. SAFR-179]|uniref:transposase n=1 Tax=unclassified Arthrobacter TaxID=235627 RepID=UPI0009EA3408